MSSDVVIRRRRFSVVGLFLFALFVVALVLHTLFDRLTPYTSEATLQAPVVGVAPNISGTLISVKVQDNQQVRAGGRLFQIDPRRFQAPVSAPNTALAPGRTAPGGHTVATAADTEAVWMVPNLPANTLGNISLGDPVLITLNVAPGRMLDGRVASIASGVARSPGGAAVES